MSGVALGVKGAQCLPKGVVLAAGGKGKVDLSVTGLEIVDDVYVVRLASGDSLEQFARQVKDA